MRNKPSTRRRRECFALALLTCLLFSVSRARAADDFDLFWFVLGGGGGRAADDFFVLDATLGQPAPGLAADDLFVLEAGFWPAGVVSVPMITSDPASQRIDLGDPVTFSVIVSGSLPLFYQWRLNGINLAGETNATLTIPNAQLTNGGAYTVVIKNAQGIAISASAHLAFDLTRTAPANDFANRVVIGPANQIFRGDNTNATREAGEPRHAGKPGGRSVWYTWTAPNTGIATFRTLGSTFDTLLAVYTGSQRDSLVPLTANDDARDQFLTSVVRFNAVGGTTYQIAIDGFGGAEGEFVVSWDLEVAGDVLPLLLTQPASQAVAPGGAVTFFVDASGLGLTYQWFLNRRPIPGAQAASFTLNSVSAADLGYYSVAVTNNANRGVETDEAALEFGDRSAVVSFNKLADAVAVAENGAGDGGGGAFQPAAGAPAGFASVSVGAIGGQTFGNTNAVSQDACDLCGVAGGAVQWFVLQAGGDGLFTLNTAGSSFDTVLYVYTNLPPASSICARFIGCDNDGAPDGTNASLSFPAVAGLKYLVGVDGVQGARGTIQLNWSLCLPPEPFGQTGPQLVLQTPPNPAPFPDSPLYHWQRDGQPLGSSAEPLFALDAPPHGATDFRVHYTSVTNGAVQQITNQLGLFLTMDALPLSAEGLFQIALPGIVAPPIRLEAAATALTNCNGGWLWLPMTNFVLSTQNMFLVISLPTESTNRLLRVRPSPPYP